MTKIYLTSIFLFIQITIFGQQNPSNVKWEEINSKYSKVIFPEEIAHDAQKIANYIDYLYLFETKTLTTKPKKITILLFNQSVESNGFAQIAPRRSVWFVTPPQSVKLGNTEWFSTLTVHEYRHIVQYSKNDQNFNKILKLIYGNLGLYYGMYSIPGWFFEGDAVCTETALSGSGRGRLPSFEMPVKAILLDDKKVKYNTALIGSYKTYFPSEYNLGWLMTGYARNKYGADIWDKVIESTTKFPINPYAFSRKLKKYTGKNERHFYDETMQYYDSVWTRHADKINLTSFTKINIAGKKHYTSYHSPQFRTNGSIIAIKSGFDDTREFIEITPSVEEKILFETNAPANSISGSYKVSNNLIIWSEEIPDIRWGFQSYSDIKIHDLNSGKTRRLTEKKRYLSPTLSPDNKQIATVKYTTDLQCNIVLLDAVSGKEIKIFENPGNYYLRTPRWSSDGEKLVYFKSKFSGTSLVTLDLSTEKENTVIPETFENIGEPIFYKNFIIYNSPASGIDNIYAIDTLYKEKYMITSSKSGAFNADIFEDTMIYSEYTSNGFDIALIKLNPEKFNKATADIQIDNDIVAKLIQQEQNKNILLPELIPTDTFESKHYSGIKDAVNLHSRKITSRTQNSVGLELYSANLLNTVYGIAGASYNTSQETFDLYSTVQFAKYFPVFEISAISTNPVSEYKDSTAGIDDIDSWKEQTINLKISIPLNFSQGIYSTHLNFSSTASVKKVSEKNYYSPPYEIGNTIFPQLSYNINFSRNKQKAPRDISPKLGQNLYLNYKHTLPLSLWQGNLFSATSQLYFPGILKHCNLKFGIYFEKQMQAPEDLSHFYYNTNYISFIRGYQTIAYENFTKFSLDYQFPILFPDLSIGSLLYIDRIRGNVFYDYGIAKGLYSKNIYNFDSYGLEIIFQMYVFRKIVPFELGSRFSFINYNKLTFDFLVLSLPIKKPR